ncbi:hypothetical protein NEUTE1DRAFT_47964, partial [Neurospora tetrasperma FGSC 2508]
YINERFNFNYHTTSPIESANRNLKSFIISGNNYIPQLSDSYTLSNSQPYLLY